MKPKSLMGIAIGSGALVLGGLGLLMDGISGSLIGALLGGIFSGAVISSFQSDNTHDS